MIFALYFCFEFDHWYFVKLREIVAGVGRNFFDDHLFLWQLPKVAKNSFVLAAKLFGQNMTKKANCCNDLIIKVNISLTPFKLTSCDLISLSIMSDLFRDSSDINFKCKDSTEVERLKADIYVGT